MSFFQFSGKFDGNEYSKYFILTINPMKTINISNIPEYNIKQHINQLKQLIDKALDQKDERTFNKLSKELKGLLMEVQVMLNIFNISKKIFDRRP